MLILAIFRLHRTGFGVRSSDLFNAYGEMGGQCKGTKLCVIEVRASAEIENQSRMSHVRRVRDLKGNPHLASKWRKGVATKRT